MSTQPSPSCTAPRAVRVQEHQHQLWLVAGGVLVELAADEAAGLDDLGGGLGLVEHHHQAEAGDVEAQ